MTPREGLNEGGQVATNAVDKTTHVVSDVSITGTIKARFGDQGPADQHHRRDDQKYRDLTGACNGTAKTVAGQVAQNTPGVEKVVNQLAIQK
jgi:hypothetical protein